MLPPADGIGRVPGGPGGPGWVGNRRLAPLVVVCVGAASTSLAGLLAGATVLMAAGLAILAGLLPPALVHATARPDDDEGGGGPPPPGDPPPRLPPTPGPDWRAFDEARRSWERTPARR